MRNFSFFFSVDGGFSKWSDWTKCSVSCGGGSRARGRLCNNPTPEHGGKTCIGTYIEREKCNVQACPSKFPCFHLNIILLHNKTFWNIFLMIILTLLRYILVDGGYSAWGKWDSCSVTCGGGTKKRSRTCTSPAPQFGGKDCQGVKSQTATCNKQECPSMFDTCILR
jgi:hypothetical protein